MSGQTSKIGAKATTPSIEKGQVRTSGWETMKIKSTCSGYLN